MIEHEFDEKHGVLVVSFVDVISKEDLLAAYGLFDDERFTADYQVLFDARGATIGFSFDAIEAVENTHGYKNLRGVGTRTALVVDSHLQRAVAELARTVRSMWGTNWRFFADRDEAEVWLLASELGNVDLRQTL